MQNHIAYHDKQTCRQTGARLSAITAGHGSQPLGTTITKSPASSPWTGLMRGLMVNKTNIVQSAGCQAINDV